MNAEENEIWNGCGKYIWNIILSCCVWIITAPLCNFSKPSPPPSLIIIIPQWSIIEYEIRRRWKNHWEWKIISSSSAYTILSLPYLIYNISFTKYILQHVELKNSFKICKFSSLFGFLFSLALFVVVEAKELKIYVILSELTL